MNCKGNGTPPRAYNCRTLKNICNSSWLNHILIKFFLEILDFSYLKGFFFLLDISIDLSADELYQRQSALLEFFELPDSHIKVNRNYQFFK